MFNFSGKGNDGLLGGATPNNNRQGPVDTGGTDSINGKGIHYWYEYATTLSNGVKGLIDEKDQARKVAMERKAIDAGLRAVIRVCLAEIRKANPNHPLLDKKNRDRIFAKFEKEEMSKILSMQGIEEAWEPLEVAKQYHQSE